MADEGRTGGGVGDRCSFAESYRSELVSSFRSISIEPPTGPSERGNPVETVGDDDVRPTGSLDGDAEVLM